MKLQSKDGNMVVDFYPIKTPMGDVSKEWYLKINNQWLKGELI
jgi:hypothetical protein